MDINGRTPGQMAEYLTASLGGMTTDAIAYARSMQRGIDHAYWSDVIGELSVHFRSFTEYSCGDTICKPQTDDPAEVTCQVCLCEYQRLTDPQFTQVPTN